MLYAVVEEIWSLTGSDEEAKLLQLLGPVDAKDGSESAAIRAVPALKDRKGRALPPDVNRMVDEMTRTDRPEGTKQ